VYEDVVDMSLGDYVHLINPDDATRPIVGQVFKSFVPTKGYRTHHLTVCWYFRPEQVCWCDKLAGGIKR
jgi:chromatin structure-remodeling complex subunit RSC1/2